MIAAPDALAPIIELVANRVMELLDKRQQQKGPAVLTPREVARRHRRRLASVLEALHTGELVAKKVDGGRGGRGAWRIRREDAEGWAQRAAKRSLKPSAETRR